MQNSERQAYASRQLRCSNCNDVQETKWMQLRTKEGYRAIHCSKCGKQERTLMHPCQCGVICHQCLIHRVDPLVHASKKGIKKRKVAPVRKKKMLSSTRRATLVLVAKKKSQKESCLQDEFE